MKKRTPKTAPALPTLPPRPPLPSWLAIVAILIVTLPWWVAAGCDFIAIDDGTYIMRNAMVLNGLNLKGVAWAFTNTDAAFWFPLTWLSLMADTSLFGSGPIGYHVTNVLLHIANALLLYFVLKVATRAPGRSLVAALLFAMHPLRVESVAWVTERKDVLFAFFGLCSLLAYVRYAQKAGWLFYVLSLLAFAGSLLSKSMLVTLPALLLLIDIWPLNRLTRSTFSRLLIEKIPFLLMAIAVVALTVLIQGRNHSLIDTAHYPMGVRLQNAILSCMLYLRDTFYFGELSLFYPLPFSIAGEVFGTALVLFLAITITTAILAWRQPATRPLFVGWFWFVIALLPVIGLIQSGAQARADRFTYFPAIGLVVGLVFIWPETWLRSEASLWWKWGAAALIAVVTAFTVLQLSLWRHPAALYQESMLHAGESATLDFALGFQYEREGKPEKALEQYARALRLAPGYATVHNHVGTILLNEGYVDQALPHLEQAHRAYPSDPFYARDFDRALQAKAAQTGPESRSQER